MGDPPAGGRSSAPHPETLAFYERTAEQYHRATVDLDTSALYGPFLAELAPAARILDAGCGSGRDTRAFAQRGYRVTAIDASPAAIRLAAAYTGQDCRVLPFEAIAFRDEWDGIWACGSLVHVPRSRMQEVLARLLHALKKGGVLYASLRESDGERIADDGRLFNGYTVEAFRDELVRLPAFRELAVWTTADVRPERRNVRWLNFLLRRGAEA